MKKLIQTKTNLNCKIRNALSTWWSGKHAPEPSGSPLLFPHHDRHWTAEHIHTLIEFHRNQWKFIWGIASLFVTGYLFK